MKKLFGLMMALIMVIGLIPLTAYADGADTGLDVSVDFAEEYLKIGENNYQVFGKNGTSVPQNLQTIRALYVNGALANVTYGESFSVAAGSSFSKTESISISSGTDVSNSYVNVYVWDGLDNFMPVTKEFALGEVSFSFTLAEEASTSAGVYDENGVLIRTLWSAVRYGAGTHTAIWDGRNDESEIAPAGKYTVKVMSNNVQYGQDALLANSTARESSQTIMSNYQPISDMTLVGENMYYADQYMENLHTLMYFNINDIHRKAGYHESGGNRVPIRNANDGNTVYWMMFESTQVNQSDDHKFDYDPYDESVWGQRRCFIMGIDIATNTQHQFTDKNNITDNPTPDFTKSLAIKDYWGVARNSTAYGYQSAVGYEPYFASEGIGHYGSSGEVGYGDLTVQQNGNFLVAVYGNRNFVRVIDKTTGKTLKDNAITTPTAVLFDNQDRLWVAYTDSNGKYAISRFDIASDGTISVAESIPADKCLGEVLAMAVSPDGSYMVITFGKGVSKLYAYNTSDWSTKWTFGRGEDYGTDTTVYDDKFCFHDTVESKWYSYLTFQGSDYLWMGDPGNDRNYKLYVGGEGTPTISDTLWYSKQHYGAIVDTNDPTRVFFGPREYKIDYSKNGDESWTLVKNYFDTIAPYITETQAGLFLGITTMSNGKTYFKGVVRENPTVSGTQYEQSTGDNIIYELTEHGFRNTGININGWALMSDGKMTLQKAEDVNHNNVSGRALYQRKFKGFDSNNNPTWYEKEMVAFISDEEAKWNTLSNLTAISENGIVFPVKTGSYTKVFRTPDNMRDFRMGGFKAGTDANKEWLFKTAPATSSNFSRKVFPRDGAIDIVTWYDLSGQAQTFGSNFVVHYRGEGGSNGGQANVFYHYADNGLLVGVYGSPHQQQGDFNIITNGNGMEFKITQPDGKNSDTAYIYQGGEARMSGAVRTKITGLNSIKTQEIPITLGSVYRSGVLVRSYNRGDCSNTSEISNSVRYGFTLPTDVTSSGSARFETYIKVPKGEEGNLPVWAYSDGNVKIVYDNEEIINGSGIVGTQIDLSSKEYKKLTVYVTPSNGALSYFNLKTDLGEGKTDIPTKYLHSLPAEANVGYTKFDLLADLPYDSKLAGKDADGNVMTPINLGGWDFTNWGVNNNPNNVSGYNPESTWANAVYTNRMSYDWHKGSSLSLYGYLAYGNNIYATRDLGNVRSDMTSWKISTEMMMAGKPNGYYDYPTDRDGYQGRYFDILDASGKIISRITFEKDDYSLRLNDKVIYNTTKGVTDYSANLSYDNIHELTLPSILEITVSNGQVTATYRGSSVTTGVYDSGANWKAPKTLKMSAYKNCRYGPHPDTNSTDFITLDYIQYAN